MFARSLSKLLPAIAVTALLCLAAAAPRSPQMPAPNPQAAPCATFSYTGGGDSAISIGVGGVIRQPLPPGLSTAACSLGVSGTNYFGTADARDSDGGHSVQRLVIYR